MEILTILLGYVPVGVISREYQMTGLVSVIRDFTRNGSRFQSKVFIYLGFYVAFNTVQVISRRVVGRAEETSTYSSTGFCTVNC